MVEERGPDDRALLEIVPSDGTRQPVQTPVSVDPANTEARARGEPFHCILRCILAKNP